MFIKFAMSDNEKMHKVSYIYQMRNPDNGGKKTWSAMLDCI